ncbi:MAG TPA: DUF488 domain-containing protein [Terriglobia bacterium]|nr:DUF488 domain-containing protein [Terriglobia bacterium]
MNSTLFTIGFTQKTAEQFFGLLQDAGVRRVIDIRENRGGQLSGFAKYPDIAFFLDRLLGIEYVHEPLLAPSPEIRKAYKTTRDWQQYEASFLALMRQRDIPESVDLAKFEGPVALLCSEPGPEKCHRRLVAEILANYAGKLGHQFDVKHLVIAKPKRTGTTKVKRRAGTDPL